MNLFKFFKKKKPSTRDFIDNIGKKSLDEIEYFFCETPLTKLDQISIFDHYISRLIASYKQRSRWALYSDNKYISSEMERIYKLLKLNMGDKNEI